jgi:hypothetical protein
METKGDQVFYPYKNSWVQTNFHSILGKKTNL